MSSDTPTDSQPAPSEIQINVKGPSELKLQISISTDKSVAELKQAIAEKSDVPADRQRLIYSGRVLKVFLRIVVATGAGAYLTDCSLRT
ncbi:hypothetical protein AcW2_000048 [Taiwanofungus camphoratus]|nr:hypothetical protein AcW2_000048 [Antrodia cinnamomea]